MKIVLSPNPYRDRGLKAALAAQKILENSGVETVFSLPFEPEGGRNDLPKELDYQSMEQALTGADVLVCFGGDGTILHAAKDANRFQVPILGVNMGSMGFMAELEHGELSMLPKLAAGEYTLEDRMMLDVRVMRGNRQIFREAALNDAVVTKGAIARVVSLKVYADDVPMSEFSGDGVIVCTPTGSTAYSMAAGGPIVEPTAENLIITPICPHALDAKAFLLRNDRKVSIRLERLTRKMAYLSVDGGRAFRLQDGDMVEIRKSEHVTRLVRLTGRSFYEILNIKFGRA